MIKLNEANIELIKSVGIYTVSSLINSAIPFLLLPVLTKHLSPADYGILGIFQVTTQLLKPLIGLNVHQAAIRMYFDRDEIDFKAYYSNIIFMVSITAITYWMVFVGVGNYIEQWLEVEQGLLYWVLLFSVAQVTLEALLSLWRAMKQALKFGVFRVSTTTLDILLSLYFVVVMGLSWKGRVQGQVYAIMVFALIGLFVLRSMKMIRWGIRIDYIKHALNISLPLIPHVLGGMLILYSDRLFIQKMVGMEATGFYTVGYQIGMAISLLQNSFNLAWNPWLFEKLKQITEQLKRQIIRFTYLYMIGLLVITLVYVACSPLLFSWFIDEQYNDSQQFVFWIAMGFAFNGMYKMAVNYLFFALKTKWIGFITILTASINLVLNYFFITWYGAIGAAKATMVSYLIQFILAWIVSIREFPMPWFSFLKTNNEDD